MDYKREFYDTYTDNEIFEKFAQERDFFRERAASLEKNFIDVKSKNALLKSKNKELKEKIQSIKTSRKMLVGELIVSLKSPLSRLPKAVKSLLQAKSVNKTNYANTAVKLENEKNTKPDLSVSQKYIDQINQGEKERHLAISASYPEEDSRYGGIFVHNRVKKCLSEGLAVDVMKFHKNNKPATYTYENVKVLKGSAPDLQNLLRKVKYKSISLHFFNRDIYAALQEFKDHPNFLIWVYGAEIFGWNRLKFLFNGQEKLKDWIQRSNVRYNFWRKVFVEKTFPRKFIFLSQWSRKMACQDNDMSPPVEKMEVIHNFIDTELFKFEPKDVNQRYKILILKNFSDIKYAVDLCVKIVLELKKTKDWEKFEVRIIGDGKLFDEVLAPLRNLKNVVIEKGFIKQHEIAKVHKDYGIFLCPTRMDTQGISRDEAMSSGLIPVTNMAGAIAEFTDESCCVLAPQEDYLQLTQGILKIADNPALFTEMSKKASEKVRKESSYASTLAKEIGLLYNESNKRM